MLKSRAQLPLASMVRSVESTFILFCFLMKFMEMVVTFCTFLRGEKNPSDIAENIFSYIRILPIIFVEEFFIRGRCLNKAFLSIIITKRHCM